jgi:hypothetical protein
MNRFDQVARRFVWLCQEYGMPVPRVEPSLETDPCDFTSAEEVRLNVVAAGDIDMNYHARHVFGHYLCDLHCSEPNGNQDWADPVADLIAKLVEKDAKMLRLLVVATSKASLAEVRRMKREIFPVQPMPEGAKPVYWETSVTTTDPATVEFALKVIEEQNGGKHD